MKRNLQLLLVILFLAIASGNLTANDSTYIHHFPYVEWVNSVLDQGSYLLLATDDGIVKFDKVTEKAEFIYPGPSKVPSLNIRALCRDSKSNLWVRFGQGLSKFDGRNWETFDSMNSPLTNSDNSTLAPSGNGDIWIGQYYGDLFKYHNGEFTVHMMPNYPGASLYITSMQCDTNDVLWIGSSSLGLMSYNGKTWKRYDSTNSQNPSNCVNSFVIDVYGSKWVATNRGLASFSDTTWTVWNTKNSAIPQDTLLKIAAGKDGSIWALGQSGLSKYKDGQFTNYVLEANVNAKSMICDSNGIIWIGTDSGFMRFDGETLKSWQPYSTQVPIKNLYSIAFDKKGVMWLGLRGKIISYDGQNYLTYDRVISTVFNKIDRIKSINVDSTGNIWFLSENAIVKYDGEGWERIDSLNSQKISNDILDLIIDYNGGVWICLSKSLMKYDGKYWTSFTPDSNLIKDDSFLSAAIDNEGCLWFISKKGMLYKYSKGVWTSHLLRNISEDIIEPVKLCIDKKGNKWIGTFTSLWKYDNENLVKYQFQYDSTKKIEVTDIALDENDIPWISTSLGISKIVGNKIKIYGYLSIYDTHWYYLIDDLCFDAKGNLWFASLGRLNVLYNNYKTYPDNYVKAVKMKYQIYNGKTYDFDGEPDAVDGFEILPGENRRCGIRPVVTFKNDTKDQELQFEVGATIYKDYENSLVFRKSMAVTAEALANPDSSGVQWVDEIGNPLYFPKDSTYKGLPPGGYVRVSFDPFIPNEILPKHHGRLILRAFSKNLSLPDSTEFPYEDKLDDTLTRVVYSLNRIDVLHDDCNEYVKSGSARLPSPDIWVNKGVEVVDGYENCYLPMNSYLQDGDINHRSFTRKYAPVYLMNRKVGDADVPPGKRGGDTLTSHIIDIRYKYNATISFSYQRTGKVGSYDRGWCDNTLVGPEHRVIAPGDTFNAIREPDELILEYICDNLNNIEKLLNPCEEDWHILPRRGGAPPERDNPPLTIFGGGGYRVALWERDKDSTLTRNEGLRPDIYDDGKDDYFKIAQITIPDTVIKKGGFIRFRLRVNAENNTKSGLVYDDSDNLFVDGITTIFPCECGEYSIQSLGLNNVLPVYSLNSTSLISPYLIVKNHTTINGPAFWVELRMKLKSSSDWNDGSGFDYPMYYFLKQLPYLIFYESKKIELPPWNITGLSEYLKPGKNVIQLWGNILIPGGDHDASNDTLYTEQEIWFDKGMGYDNLENHNSDVGYFSYPGCGISLYGHSRGDDSVSNAVGDIGGSGPGQIAMRFDLQGKDTIFGFQAFFTQFATSPESIRFAIYKDHAGKPGDLVEGSILDRNTGFDDLREQWYINEYSTYLYINKNKPPVLEAGTYWAAIMQLGEVGLELGAQGFRAGMVTTVYDSVGNGSGGTSLLIDKSLRKLDTASKHLINDSPWYYENNIGSGNWVPFAPTTGNPGYSHLDHAGTIKNANGSARTYSRGTFVPMLRVYMDGSHYIPSGMEDQPESSNEKIHAFPNPAVNLAIIDYVVEKPGLVDITISNMFGEDVSQLFSGYRAPGNYELQLSAYDLPSGMYLIRLKQASGTATAKLMIVK